MFEIENKTKRNSRWEKWQLYIRKGMLIVAAFAFFGLLYPDLCMVEDTCKVVVETANGEEEVLVPKGSELYYALLSAKPQDIKLKSRLLEAIQSYFERNKQEE
ncbi:MAG TPA: hypothetical protein VJY54_03385 [Lachnospiraceae bacterium]|nr:hypothetical protein [Lachnospiraceae bacterium]